MKRIAEITVLILLLAGPQGLGRGGDSSGGGSVVETEHGSVLLDLYLHPKWDPTKQKPGVKLPHTPFQEQLGLGWWNKDQSPVMHYLFERLRVWKPMGRGLVLSIAAVLTGKTQFFYTFDKLRRYAGFHLPDSVEVDNEALKVRTAILYDRLLGPVIYAPLWNKLSIETQAGLLIHEALRYFQAVHPQSISESQLQDLVATILLTDPAPDGPKLNFPDRKSHPQWLESKRFVGPPLLETFQLPTWHDPMQLAEGVRFRLYYRWVQDQFPKLFELFEKHPDADLEKQIRSLLPACGPNVHEAMEINCAAFFKSSFKAWKGKARHPTVRDQLDEMILRDGDKLHLWWLQGQPSPLITLFYDDLFRSAYPKLDDAEIRNRTKDLVHLLVIRGTLNGNGKLKENEQQSLDAIAEALSRHLNERILDPPGS